MRTLILVLMTIIGYLTCITAAYATSDLSTQVGIYLSNPNIIYFLLLLAIYGIFFELINPGLFAPGILGVMALGVAIYAMQGLPVNYAGLSLLFVGLAFIVLEFSIFTYGLLGISGLIAFVLGSVMLFDITDPRYQLSLHLIIAMTALSIAFFAVVVTIAVRAYKRTVVTGKEGLIAAKGTVISKHHDKLIIRVMGELWEAQSTDQLNVDDTVIVTHLNNLTLTVIKDNQSY